MLYLRQPALTDDALLFVTDDDLFSAPLAGGAPRRLTAAAGQISAPVVSPDGTLVAFTSTEQGSPEIYIMAVQGSEPRRLTFTGAKAAHPVAFTPDGAHLIFRSDLEQPWPRALALYSVPVDGGLVENLDIGLGHHLHFQPGGPGRVLCRFADDLSRWKRYRGGTAGVLWIDEGDQQWRRLLPHHTAGLIRPHWHGDRIYFLSDLDPESPVANLYSCDLRGEDLQQHTHSEDFYLRALTLRGDTLAYACGADLFLYDLHTHQPRKVELRPTATRQKRREKFFKASEFFADLSLTPDGTRFAMTPRGKLVHLPPFEGAPLQLGAPQGVRYRLPRYLDDGARLLVVSDEGGEERFELHDLKAGTSRVIDTTADIGRPRRLVVTPDASAAVFSNHRHEVHHLDLSTGTCRLIDRNPFEEIAGLALSPDGQWVAYGFFDGHHLGTSAIRVVRLDDGEIHQITSGRFRDVEPVFDPQGRYLYFLSLRDFNPTYSQLLFDLAFPEAMKPCVITLRKDTLSPLHREPRDDTDDTDGSDTSDTSDTPAFSIDLDDIQDRVEVLPVDSGRYADLLATKNAVFFRKLPPLQSVRMHPEEDRAELQRFDLKDRKASTFFKGVSAYAIATDADKIALWAKKKLRVVDSTKAPENKDQSPGRDSGVVDLDRLSLTVDPAAEWTQMLREMWRLMRDHFWRSDLSGVDWDAVWDRYSPLVARVSTRQEFSDLAWEMIGELGTSHAYEIGGDYQKPPQHQPGFLGATFRWDPSFDAHSREGAYRFETLLRGDPWDPQRSSPLRRPGLNVQPGDALLAINGLDLSEHRPPAQLLMNQVKKDVALLIASDGDAPRTIIVQTLADEQPLRYRDWVEANRQAVHDASDGRIGYVHIPEMGPTGFGEFFRNYFADHSREGLIVDVRFNGGGHVSQLLLHRLARKPLGYAFPRWGGTRTYPSDCVSGPIVGLTNELAGSDGDIFTHNFRVMNLGPMIGKRTWGGVVGICHLHTLVDGSIATQPEVAFWFNDVGFDVENYGAEPDIEVELPPGVHHGGDDPQLRAAIDEALRLLEHADHPRPPTLQQALDLS